MNRLREIKTSVIETTVNDLLQEDQELVKHATEASKMAYAPYSQFYVGAAVFLDNGKIISGNNQENAAYPSGLCAERVAVFSAGAQYPNAAVKKIAITAHCGHFEIKEPVSPCGACRQALAEYEKRHNSPISLILSSPNGKVIIVNSIKCLLPLMFSSENLKG